MADQGLWRVVCQITTPNQEALIPVQPTLKALRAAVQSSFGLTSAQGYTLTDYHTDFEGTDDLHSLAPDSTIWVVDVKQGPTLTKERIAFPPHPKTLTHAGDYEYFAAQGRAPFPYALAELIDNSLRATIRGRAEKRQIVVSFVLNSASNPSSGLISVWDNGCGMTKQALNEWAVMNLSMEDRGTKPAEESVARGAKSAAGASRFLSGNLSYFGVGSKNAAFYLGKRIKVVTKTAGSTYVHELSIGASDLERRYKDGEAVYEEDLVHRHPGLTSTLCAFERHFPISERWVEREAGGGGTEGPKGASFTRIVIGEVKSELLALVGNTAGRQQLCRSLAHLYHYYIHGEKGNLSGASKSGQPETPQISIECLVGNKQLYSCNLAEVGDDLESLYLQGKKSELHFSLDVAGKGQVEGVLWYFPFIDDRETLPLEEGRLGHNPVTHYNMTQQGTQAPLTQQGPQHLRDGGSDEENEMPLWQRSTAPLFEAFWQGRLIPGARIESLPFIEAIRHKRAAAVRDVIPDECFLRLRGALFFGPGFLVTRNKLTFRDNLQELLKSATKKERAQDRLFKEWMTRCHADLDKVIRFESIASQELQAEAKKELGKESSVFERISGGSKTVQRGDIIRLAVKPVLIGRVEFFVVSQDVKEEGVYSNGQVTVQPLPVEVHGSQAKKIFPLRRIDVVLNEEEAAQILSKELAKVPSRIIVEPAEIGDVQAGQSLPSIAAAIVNGAEQRVVKGHLSGKKVEYSMTQQLWFCPEGVGTSPDEEASDVADRQPDPQKQSKRKKRQGKQAENQRLLLDPPTAKAELISEIESSKPTKEAFEFGGGVRLERAGVYVLRFVMNPARPASGMLKAGITFNVQPGPAAEMVLQGEGRAAMATADLMLGEWLPDITMRFQDEFGNSTMVGVDLDQHRASLDILKAVESDESLVQVPELEAFCTQCIAEDGGSITLASFQIFGPSDFQPGSGPLPIFAEQASASAEEGCAQKSSSAVGASLSREIRVRFGWPGLSAQVLPLRLLPGLPRTLSLLPGHPFTQEGGAGKPRCAEVASKGSFPEFQVVARDQWENVTIPFEDMPFVLVVEGKAVQPEESTFKFDPHAWVAGLKSACCQPQISGSPVLPLTCRLTFPGVDEEAAREVIGGAELPSLTLGVILQPSDHPDSIQLLHNGKPLPAQIDEETRERFVVFENVAAGSLLQNLAVQCVDEGGRIVVAEKAGKVQVDWSRGSKRVCLRSEPIPVPDLQVQENVREGFTSHWVRFGASGGIALELGIRLLVVPAEPRGWTAEAVDSAGETQGIDAKGNVACGSFFRLSIAVTDAFNNRCCGQISAAVPAPCILPEAASADGQLKYDVSEWEQGWVTKADGNEVFEAKMRIGGDLGVVHLHIHDSGGENGSPLLQPDRLEVTLQPGSASTLMFDAPPVLHCGMQSTLGELRVKAMDAYDNVAAGSIEVVLQPQAVAVDRAGQAATVTAAAGNRVRTENGVAIFRDIKLSAEHAGTYILKAKPASRKVSGEACLTIKMEPANVVTAIRMELPDVPLSKGLRAGDATHVAVIAATEDGQTIPAEAAVKGLRVAMTVPHEGRQSESILDIAAEQASQSEGCSYKYSTGHFTVAGQYTFTAEYTESREHLAANNRSCPVRAAAVHLEVASGPCSAVMLDSQRPPERLAATNAESGRERLLLRAAVIQLQDKFGNAVRESGVPVTASLEWKADAAQPRGILPRLEMAEGGVHTTDEHGRAIFGDLLIAEGTGRVSGAEAGSGGTASMELELRFALSDPERAEVKNWTCSVVFSDDAAKFAALQSLNEEHQRLLDKREEINEKLASARSRASDAAAQFEQACKTAAARQSKVTERADTAAEVEAALQRAQQQRSSSCETGASFEARYGAQEQAMTKALTRCLQADTEGVLGVFAQLATVESEALARILAANYRSMLVVLIVAAPDCRQHLEAALAQHRLVMPDILCMTHAMGWNGRGPSNGETPGWQSAGQLARSLQRSACRGADAPLPVALPHTRAMQGARKDIQGAKLSAAQWPEGCLGYAFNLMRPVLRGHRAALLFPMLGHTLVFENLKQAEFYREYCTQVLRCNVADMITLDFKRISAKGIISGASFRVPALVDATVRFGTMPPDQGEQPTQAELEEANLKQLLDAIAVREDAKRQLEQAEQEEEAARDQWEGELGAVNRSLEGIKAQFGSHSQGRDSNRGKRGRLSNDEAAMEGENEGEEQENREPSVQPHAATKTKKRRLTKMRA